jgi:hypothetical protein
MGFEDYPTFQGEYLSFAEIKPVLSIGGALDFKTKDYAAIDCNDSLVPSKVRGAGPGIRGRTVGIYDADASMSMYHASAIAFRAALLVAAKAQGHNKIALVKFDFILNWSPLDGIGLIYTTTIRGARIQERSQKNSATTADANISEMPLSVIRIEEFDPTTGEVIVLA